MTLLSLFDQVTEFFASGSSTFPRYASQNNLAAPPSGTNCEAGLYVGSGFPVYPLDFSPGKKILAFKNWSLKFWWKKLILFKSSYKYCQCFVKFFEMIPKLYFKSRFYFVIFVVIVIKKKRNWKKRLFDRVDEKKKQIRNRTIHISIR